MSLPLDKVTGLAAKLIGSISGRRSPVPRENAAQERHVKALLHPQGYNIPELSEDRVRVVVFRDEKGVKTPVFDSQVHCDPLLVVAEDGDKEPQVTKSWGDNMIRHGDRASQLTDSTCSEGWRDRRSRLGKKPSSDSELLGEMMFGSMPMKVAGNTVKVHYIRSTDQLMLTKVFYLQRRVPTQCSLSTEVFIDSCPLPGQEGGDEGGNKNSFILSITRPPEPPLSKRTRSLMMPHPPSSSRTLHSLPPHLSPSSSTAYSPPSPLTVSISSSYTRRKNRSRATSLEVGSELYRKVLKPLTDRPPRKGRKYAIGVIITLSEMSHLHIKHFKDFIFSHFTLIDAHLERLKEGMEEALLTRMEPQRQNVLSRATQAYQSFLGDLLSLYRARRIHCPVWLGLVSQQSRRREICLQFMEELGSILSEIDNKDTKFFFSTLLTAVLSHHLAWVYTVSHTNDSRHSRNSKSLAVLAESHPYNPLWAQLGDMFGAVSQPLKVTRTIITGQSYTLVCRLLYLLSYFIRCSEIQPGVVGSSITDTTTTTTTAHTNSSHDLSHTISAAPRPPPPPPASSSSSTHPVTLEDSEDMFESRASSAVTMCPSPHTPAAVSDRGENHLVRTHPFNFRSPVPSTPELRSHASSHELLHGSASGSVSDMHSTWRSGSSTDAISLTGLRTPHKTGSESLDSGHSHQTTPRKMTQTRTVSSAGSWSSTATAPPPPHPPSQEINRHRAASSSNYEGDPVLIGDQVGMGESPLAALSIPSYSPGKEFSASDSQSCASDTERRLLGVEDDITNSDPNDDAVSRLSGVTPRRKKKKKKREWEYVRSRDTCAPLAELESMGMCKLDIDHKIFDITQNYAAEESSPSSAGDDDRESPYRIESFDSLSDLAGNSNTFSRNGSSNSIGGGACLNHPTTHNPPFTSSSSSSSHPHSQHAGTNSQQSPTHPCGSIDSGYSNDNSIDVSSLTESSHTGMNDSLYTGPRFSIGLSVGNHCHPESSNVFMRPSRQFPSCNHDTKTPLAKNCVCERLGELEIANDDGALREDLERTAMKRQESDASYVSSMAVRPPTTQRSDTLDSSTTPVDPSEGGGGGGGRGGGSEGGESLDGDREDGENDGGTLTRRKRSGAFSYHSRGGSAGDTSTLCSRGSSTLERSGEEVRRLVKERGRQVAGKTEGEEEDEVFGTGAQVDFSIDGERGGGLTSNTDDVMRNRNDVMTESEVFRELPELRIQPSPPPPQPLDYCGMTGEGCSGDETELQLSHSVISDTTCPMDPPLSCLEVSEEVNVEESLSAVSINALKEKRSLLAEKLLGTSLRAHAGLPSTPLVDFTEVDMPSLEEFHLAEEDTEALTSDPLGDCSAHTHTQPVQDFGHSLFAGHSPMYLPDFVLHGTSESLHSFQPKLERHLSSMVKHSTVDEPVEHGVAIIADTDNWTCRLMVATNDHQTNDVDLSVCPVRLSRYVRLMMASFRGMWEMRMPPEFCLSHLEDRLLELNERGLLLANNIMHYGNDVDLGEVLPTTFKSLSIREADENLLLSLAGAHCPDPDLTARLNYTTMRRTLTSRK